MDEPLEKKRCVPCRGDVPPLKGQALQELLERLGGGWTLAGEHHLEKVFQFRDYRETIRFVNIIAEIAEEQNHHPDLHVSWGRVTVVIYTHKIDGLTESDFVLAARFDAALKAL
ncbi:MAG: 4a-hydroxytetrahydrobiopterin dehydratase [Candidatus Sumerlaeia bacterium]